MGDPAAKPEPLAIVEIAGVAHAVPDVGPVDDFGQPVPLTPGDILARHHGAGDDQLADLSIGQGLDVGQGGDRAIDDADHLPANARKTPPDADARAETGLGLGLTEDFAGRDRGHGQGLGGAVRSVDFGPVGQAVFHPHQHVGRHRGSGRDDPHERFDPLARPFALQPNAVPDRRRTERLGHAPIANRGEEFLRHDLGRSGRIHHRDDGSDARRAVKEPEQRKAGQIDLAAANLKRVAQLLDLGLEVSMLIEDALGWAGAARGEDDRRRVFAPRGGGLEIVLAALARAQPESCHPKTAGGRPSR